jgi:hypothetical protein
MTGSLTVTYVLFDYKMNQMFSETVESKSEAAFTEELHGLSRAVLVVERYVKLNIQSFISILSKKAALFQNTNKNKYNLESASIKKDERHLDKFKEIELQRLPENHRLKFQLQPPRDFNSELSEPQARWCIYESIRLKKLRAAKDSKLATAKIADFEASCGKAKLNFKMENLIVSEINAIRPILEGQANYYFNILISE